MPNIGRQSRSPTSRGLSATRAKGLVASAYCFLFPPERSTCSWSCRLAVLPSVRWNLSGGGFCGISMSNRGDWPSTWGVGSRGTPTCNLRLLLGVARPPLSQSDNNPAHVDADAVASRRVGDGAVVPVRDGSSTTPGRVGAVGSGHAHASPVMQADGQLERAAAMPVVAGPVGGRLALLDAGSVRVTGRLPSPHSTQIPRSDHPWMMRRGHFGERGEMVDARDSGDVERFGGIVQTNRLPSGLPTKLPAPASPRSLLVLLPNVGPRSAVVDGGRSASSRISSTGVVARRQGEVKLHCSWGSGAPVDSRTR